MASASTGPTATSRSEDILSEKTDICLANAVVKGGIGLGAGVVLSVVLFRRRSFPVWLGLGGGLGAAYSDCQRVFNPVAIPGYRVVTTPTSPSSDESKPASSATTGGKGQDKRLL